MDVKEQKITVGDMEFAVKIWGDENDIPVLALHGWLDNSASFDVLAPMLEGCCVVAVDLAGQGLSSHRPDSGSYLIWSDLLEMLSIADHFGWTTFNVVGHSRGGMISSLLAIAAPERMQRLVLLDSFLPFPTALADTTKNLREHIRDERRYLKRRREGVSQKPFATLDRAIKARQQLMPMEDASARRILERGTVAVDGGFIWRHDERLKARSAFKLTAKHNDVLFEDLETETLVMLTEKTMSGMPNLEDYVERHQKVSLQTVTGNHHFHLEAPAVELAVTIGKFLREGAQ